MENRMRKVMLVCLIGALAPIAGASAQQGALQTAAGTLGVANIKTLQFTGSGQNFSVGQNYTAVGSVAGGAASRATPRASTTTPAPCAWSWCARWAR